MKFFHLLFRTIWAPLKHASVLHFITSLLVPFSSQIMSLNFATTDAATQNFPNFAVQSSNSNPGHSIWGLILGQQHHNIICVVNPLFILFLLSCLSCQNFTVIKTNHNVILKVNCNGMKCRRRSSSSGSKWWSGGYYNHSNDLTYLH